MGKPTIKAVANDEGNTEKALPDPTLLKRPGTSRTELGLRTDLKKASSAYTRAQRAEQAYRAKKQASTARTNMTAAKQHYGAAFKSLKLGTRFFLSALGALPGILGEKRASRMEKREGIRREKTIAKRKKFEEEMKREEEAGVIA